MIGTKHYIFNVAFLILAPPTSLSLSGHVCLHPQPPRQVSLCNSDCPEAYHVDQAGLDSQSSTCLCSRVPVPLHPALPVVSHSVVWGSSAADDCCALTAPSLPLNSEKWD